MEVRVNQRHVLVPDIGSQTDGQMNMDYI